MRAVLVVMPAGVDDPATPSGGNTYDLRLCAELAAQGLDVGRLCAAGNWPHPSPADLTALAAALDDAPDGGVVLLDGLVACAAPDAVVPAARRLRLAVLVHLPLGDETGQEPADTARLAARERRTLATVDAIVATSIAAAGRLVARHGLPPAAVHVAAPGVDVAPNTSNAPNTPNAPGSSGTSTGERLLCVASVTPRKGHDVLVEALGRLEGLPWTCACAGALDRTPAHAEQVRARAADLGVGSRLHWLGPRTGAQLADLYASSDLLVLTSLAEPYGMVVTEALARGLPVVASDVDGVPEALGRTPDGEVPGLLVPPGDPTALTDALRAWLADAALRERLRAAAATRRGTLRPWADTAAQVATVLHRIAGHEGGR